MSFETLGLAPEITRALAELGYANPTPIQAEAIPLVMAGNDLMGGAQTGTGKTAAFSLPLLHRLAQAGPVSGPRSAVKTGAGSSVERAVSSSVSVALASRSTIRFRSLGAPVSISLALSIVSPRNV